MPWHVAKTDQCPASEPWGVIKDATGKVIPGGCHGSRSDALDQVAALYANEKEAPHVSRTAQFLHHQQVRITPLGQVRDMDEKTGRFAATVLHYDTEDDYGSEMAPRMFEESLRARLPRVVWGHDWTDPIGRYTAYEDSAQKLDLIGQLDLGMIENWSSDGEVLLSSQPAVPRAHQAYAQMASGTVDQLSVGFWPIDGDEVKRGERYVFRFTKGRLDEVSLVLVGAVPGTQILAMRSAPIIVRAPQPMISKDAASAIILDLHGGRIDLADALQAIKQTALNEAADPPAEPDSATVVAGAGDGAGEPGSETPPPGGSEPDPAPAAPADPPEPEPVEEPEPDPKPETDSYAIDWSDYSDIEAVLTGRGL